MTDRLYALLVWLGTVSVLTFVLFGWDKGMAKLGRRRIPESALLSACLLGGAAGGLLGMALFRHKIRKSAFRVGVPLLLALHAALLAAVLLLT